MSRPLSEAAKAAVGAIADEYAPLFDELTTSDLQGCVEAAARKAVAAGEVGPVVDAVLEEIYGRVKGKTARSAECECDDSSTCGHCLRNAPPWHYTLDDGSAIYSGPLQSTRRKEDGPERDAKTGASSTHFRNQCSCGAVLSQCKCSSCERKVTVKEMACGECKRAAELMHSDDDLGQKLEPAVPGPEAGPSNDELHENSHEENGASPVLDGDLHSPERANVNAMREALDAQAEMEVGKPVAVKQEELKAEEKAETMQIDAKPGKQIIINIASWDYPARKRAFLKHAGLLTVDEVKRAGREYLRKIRTSAIAVAAEGGDAVLEVAGTKYALRGEDGRSFLREYASAPGSVNKLAEKYIWRLQPHTAALEMGDGWELAEAGGSWRFVNHRERLATAGFGSRDAALRNKGGYLDTPAARGQMAERYGELYPETHTAAEPIGGEDKPVTSGHGGGMFGGTDLEGPKFHVGFTVRGRRRQAKFGSMMAARAFEVGAAKLGAGGWTMKCPWCRGEARKERPQDEYQCPCGWTSAVPKAASKTAGYMTDGQMMQEFFRPGGDRGGPIHGREPVPVTRRMRRGLGEPAVERHEEDEDQDKTAAVPYKTPSLRGPSSVAQDGAGRRMQSADGQRWAVSRNQKRALADHKFDVVECWTLKERGADGKAVTVAVQRGEEEAREFCGLGKTASAAADPARRNLALELLRNGPQTTGQIEAALGGGRHTNYAYPVLQELAREGLVSHSKMRWRLKAAAEALFVVVFADGSKTEPMGRAEAEEAVRQARENLEEEAEIVPFDYGRPKSGAAKTAGYEGWTDWQTWYLHILIDQEPKSQERMHELAELAVKAGWDPGKLAETYERVFQRYYRQVRREYEGNAADARAERGAYERRQLEGTEPPPSGDKYKDMADRLFEPFYDMGGTSGWEEPFAEPNWREIAEYEMGEARNQTGGGILATDEDDKDLAKSMGISLASKSAGPALPTHECLVCPAKFTSEESAISHAVDRGHRVREKKDPWIMKERDKMSSEALQQRHLSSKSASDARLVLDMAAEMFPGFDFGDLSAEQQREAVLAASRRRGVPRRPAPNTEKTKDPGADWTGRPPHGGRLHTTAADEKEVGGGETRAETAPEWYCWHCGKVQPIRPYSTEAAKGFEPVPGVELDEEEAGHVFECDVCGVIIDIDDPRNLDPATVHQAGGGAAKTEADIEKEAGFNFFFPGQVLKEFYPEIQHEVVDYPNATNQPMDGAGNPEITGDGGHDLDAIVDGAMDPSIVETILLPGDVTEPEPLSMTSADRDSERPAIKPRRPLDDDKPDLYLESDKDWLLNNREALIPMMEKTGYSSTSPAGGMGIGRDGKPEVLEGAPLRKENDIRGPMFTDEFFGQYEGVPGAAMAVASKTAAGDEAAQFGVFLKRVCGEIAATMIAAFKVTSRQLLDKVPGVGEVQLAQVEQPQGMSAFNTVNTGSRVKYLMGKLNDGEIKAAINEAWAQGAVWHDGPAGGFVYEVFVRPETIDTDTMIMRYKFVCGTKEQA